MDESRRRDLLPGVAAEDVAPAVHVQSNAVVRAARRRAAIRDVLNVAVLLAIDLWFQYWPKARVPWLDRHQSLLLVIAMNLMVMAGLWLARAMPVWRARRVARTWCATERDRAVFLEPRRARR
jgi:hypothetical protein